MVDDRTVNATPEELEYVYKFMGTLEQVIQMLPRLPDTCVFISLVRRGELLATQAACPEGIEPLAAVRQLGLLLLLDNAVQVPQAEEKGH
jgi:hypothetical protein